MKSLSNDVVLLTGANGGIGQALVRNFLKEGCQLILTDLQGENLHVKTAMMLQQNDLSLYAPNILGYISANLATYEGCSYFFTEAKKLTPHIDILINNAGLGISGAFADIPRERWVELIHLNLLAPLNLTSLVLPEMKARDKGYIINISSIAGIIGVRGLSPYCASKFGLRGFSKALAIELRSSNVKVISVYPFFTRTPILNSPHFGTMERQKIPQRFVYKPDFVAGQIIRGIRQGKTEIYPGFVPRIIHVIKTTVPWLLSGRI